MTPNDARIEFALRKRESIRKQLWDLEMKLWHEAAKEAKRLGLYAQSTYLDDAATGLKHKAGTQLVPYR